MTPETKTQLVVLATVMGILLGIIGGTYLASYFITTNYETGVVITPNPEYRIELQYSNVCESEGVYTLQLQPRLFDHAYKVVKMNYKAPKRMHLWTWRLLYGDEEVFKETIDSEVKTGDGIQFIYVVDE